MPCPSPVARHIKTYEEAARRGRNALENDIQFAQFAREDGKPLPTPRTFAHATN